MKVDKQPSRQMETILIYFFCCCIPPHNCGWHRKGLRLHTIVYKISDELIYTSLWGVAITNQLNELKWLHEKKMIMKQIL